MQRQVESWCKAQISDERAMWSLSNASTRPFKKLDPVPQFKITARLGEFLANLVD
jgi:hypothetical protein